MTVLKSTDKNTAKGVAGISPVADVSDGLAPEKVKPLLRAPDTTQVVINTTAANAGAHASDSVSVRIGGKRTRGVAHLVASEFSDRARTQLGNFLGLLRSMAR